MLHSAARSWVYFVINVWILVFRQLVKYSQKDIRNVINDISSSKNVDDDITCFGKINMNAMLKQLQNNGHKVHQTKCKFNKWSIQFYDIVLGKGWILDLKRVEAFQISSEIRSFLSWWTTLLVLIRIILQSVNRSDASSSKSLHGWWTNITFL